MTKAPHLRPVRSNRAASTPPSRGSDISGHDPAPTPITLDGVHGVYRRWFGAGYDLQALDVVLSVAAAEQLGGDPAWLLVVGGSGAAKTESIMPLVAAGAVAVSTINGEAALLSGTAKKERAKNATGGLLQAIGEHGLLVIKDVTSILSMNRDTRALVLAALREVYDGSWSRHVGTDGGQTIKWRGRLVVIGAVTTAWDAAHQVIATMGDRFILVRLDSGAGTDGDARTRAGRQAMANVDHEQQMRSDLAHAVRDLLAGIDLTGAALDDGEVDELLTAADLVTRARTAVERDYQGDPMYAHALEMPTRMAKQLAQVARGGLALGMTREAAMAAAMRCAQDSMPPHRLSVLADVVDHPAAGSFTADVVKRVQQPRKTVDRTLRELHLLGLLTVEAEKWGTSTRWAYRATEGSTAALPKLARNVTTPGGTES